MLKLTFQAPTSSRRLPFGLADVAVILGALVVLALIARVGSGAFVAFVPPNTLPKVSLDRAMLPYYAGRSMLRMLVALLASTLFTFVYGWLAAKSRRLERVLVPLLDILQSVPVLGFLSITVTGFIALFPGSLLGLEAASIFAIFTAQAWNMTFSFYQSLRTVPNDLLEASALYRLSGWQRFRQIEAPVAMIGVVWNAMLGFGGGWFFLSASEAISVLNKDYTLPGIGSYVAVAAGARDMGALAWAALTIAIVIILTDQLLWKPLVAWSDKFRLETSASGDPPQSWIYDLVRTSRIPHVLGAVTEPIFDAVNGLLDRLTAVRISRTETPPPNPVLDRVYDIALLVAVALLVVAGGNFVVREVGVHEVFRAFGLGLLTLGRVFILLIFASLVWTPIGVAIGLDPRLTRALMPVVQFLSSFPSSFVFPFAAFAFITYHIDIGWGSIALMALGAQWYILFNSIAGAAAIPTELREMTRDLGVRGWKLWRTLIIPGIFSTWVTGAITASGGAWNASIVSEVIAWGAKPLVAHGLGSYIAEATGKGDWPRITLGVSIMSLFVVAINRVLWRRLYRLAEAKYRL